MKHGCDEPDRELGVSYFFLGDQLSSLPFEPFKIMGKTSKSSVPVLSAGPLYSLLSTLLAAWGFCISGQLLWSSVASMLARCMAPCGACISRRAPKIESFFESRWVGKILGFCMAQSGMDPRPWSGRIRTIRMMF